MTNFALKCKSHHKIWHKIKHRLYTCTKHMERVKRQHSFYTLTEWLTTNDTGNIRVKDECRKVFDGKRTKCAISVSKIRLNCQLQQCSHSIRLWCPNTKDPHWSECFSDSPISPSCPLHPHDSCRNQTVSHSTFINNENYTMIS